MLIQDLQILNTMTEIKKQKEFWGSARWLSGQRGQIDDLSSIPGMTVDQERTNSAKLSSMLT